MTNEATTARDNASHCEGIKYALRQSKDGMVVSFVLHPNDIPSTVQLAPIGSRFMLAFVEINDDDTPKEVMPSAPNGNIPIIDKAPAPVIDTPEPVRARHWKDLPYPTQTGILARDPKFWKFCQEDGCMVSNADEAAEHIRAVCDVQSRSEIRPNTAAEQRWLLIVSAYRAWDMAPSVGAV